jgi:hypothetical protein
VWNLPKTKIGFAGLYEYEVKHPILPKHIAQFRKSFRIGDEVEIPMAHDESSFRPNYISRCTVKEIHPHFVVVSHGGLWNEAINYVDFMCKNSKASVVIASKGLSDEYYRLLDEYWKVNDLIYAGRKDLIERFDSLEERLKEIEPLILQSERFTGNKASTKPYGGEVWKELANQCKEELRTC